MRLGSIKLRLLVAFLICFVAAQFGLLYANLNILEQDYVAQVERRAQGLGAALNPVLATMLAERNYAAASQVLEEQRQGNRVAYFLLYGSDGRPVAEGGWGMGKSVPPEREGFSEPDGDRLYHAKVRLSYAGGSYGELRYGVSTEGMAEAKSRIIRQSLLVGGGAILAIAALFGFTLRYWLDREFRGLIAASESIADGNFNVRVPPPDSTEFGVLADAFNRMSGAIRSRVDRLAETEHYQRTLLANLPMAVAVHHPDGSLLFCNAKAATLLGFSEEQAKGLAPLPSWQFVAEDGTPLPGPECPVTRRVQEALQPVDNYVLGIIRQEGEEPLWVLASAYPDFDGEGRLRQVVVSFADITARRRAEDMLRETRAKLQQIVDVSPAATYVVKLDPPGGGPSRVAFLSQHISAITGYSLEEWAQPGFWEEHIHPEDHERVLAAQATLLAQGALQHEYRFLRWDGHAIWVLDRLVLVRGEQGRPTEVIGSWLDISEQRRGALRLKHMNRLYTLLSRVNEAIIRMGDAQTLFEEVCRIAVEEGEFVMAWVGEWGGGDAEVTPVAKWGREDGYLGQLHRLGVLRQCPTATALRLGEARLVQDIDPATAAAPWCKEAVIRGYRAFGAFPIRRGGKVTGSFNLYADTPGFFSDDIVRLVEDMTVDVSFALDSIDQDLRRREAEEEVRRLNEELEQRVEERTRLLEAANKELEAFSYSVSHDLRAPLRSIDGFSQILLRKYADRLDGTGHDYLGRVRRASQRMGELIDDLLQLSRVSRSDLRKEAIDLSRLAREVVQELRENQPGRQVEFSLGDGIVAEADGRLMRVALDNLLGNAWKFTDRQDTPRIEFGILGREGERVYYVRDNGAGFDMQYADKLFGPFQRLHKEEEFEGSGIGLATVQRIVSRHGGRVWGEGEVGKGAAFYFTL